MKRSAFQVRVLFKSCHVFARPAADEICRSPYDKRFRARFRENLSLSRRAQTRYGYLCHVKCVWRVAVAGRASGSKWRPSDSHWTLANRDHTRRHFFLFYASRFARQRWSVVVAIVSMMCRCYVTFFLWYVVIIIIVVVVIRRPIIVDLSSLSGRYASTESSRDEIVRVDWSVSAGPSFARLYTVALCET